MFDCRVCGATPFAKLFGFPERRTRSSHHDEPTFLPRGGPQLDVAAQQWLEYTNSRIDLMWPDPEKQLQVFRTILCGVDARVDPVLGTDPAQCAFWHGQVGPTGYPVVVAEVDGPVEMSVLRIIVFAFSDDDAFEEVRDHEQITTVCGNRACIALSHIALPSLVGSPR